MTLEDKIKRVSDITIQVCELRRKINELNNERLKVAQEVSVEEQSIVGRTIVQRCIELLTQAKFEEATSYYQTMTGVTSLEAKEILEMIIKNKDIHPATKL